MLQCQTDAETGILVLMVMQAEGLGFDQVMLLGLFKNSQKLTGLQLANVSYIQLANVSEVRNALLEVALIWSCCVMLVRSEHTIGSGIMPPFIDANLMLNSQGAVDLWLPHCCLCALCTFYSTMNMLLQPAVCCICTCMCVCVLKLHQRSTHHCMQVRKVCKYAANASA